MTDQERIIQARDKIKQDRAVRAKLVDPEDKVKEKIIKDYEAKKNRPKLQFYYAMMPQEMLEDKEISGSAIKLYGLIHCEAYDKYNPVIETTSQKQLARKMGVSVRSIFGYFKELEAKGWIKIQRRGLNLPDKITLIFIKGRR